MSDETEPPRWVCSSASPSSRRSYCQPTARRAALSTSGEPRARRVREPPLVDERERLGRRGGTRRTGSAGSTTRWRYAGLARHGRCDRVPSRPAASGCSSSATSSQSRAACRAPQRSPRTRAARPERQHRRRARTQSPVDDRRRSAVDLAARLRRRSRRASSRRSTSSDATAASTTARGRVSSTQLMRATRVACAASTARADRSRTAPRHDES